MIILQVLLTPKRFKTGYTILVIKQLLARIVWIDVLLSIGIIMVVVGVGISFKKTQGKTLGTSTSSSAKTSKITSVLSVVVKNEKIMVDVGGAVVKPGVYEFLPKDRVIDALLRSGGLSAKADRAWVEANLNRAELLHDGQKIFIPEKGSSNSSSTKMAIVVAKETKTSINYGSEAELVAVNGIGPATAQAIIKFRQEKGLFGQLEDIMHVPGIGPKSFEKIKDQIKL